MPMVVSFVLLTTLPNSEKHVSDELDGIPEVEEHHTLFGEFDFILKLAANDYEEISRIIVDRIRKIRGVTSTKTYTSAGPFTSYGMDLAEST